MSKKTNDIAGKTSIGDNGYAFQLYITGILPNSVRAIVNCKTICEKYLKGRYTLEIIDIYQQPDLTLSEELIAIPMLVKKLPLPEERVIGDLSNVEEVLKGLHIAHTLPIVP